MSFVWSAIYDEVWQGREDRSLAEPIAEQLFSQEFNLPAVKAKELATSMRMLQGKKNIYDEVNAAPGDKEADAKIMEMLGVGNPVVAGTWLDFVRGRLVYEAWKNRTSELPPSRYREIVNAFGGQQLASVQLQRPRAGCGLVTLLISLSVIVGVTCVVR